MMKRLKNWLTDIELIGLVIIISVYHYYQALAAHDPWLVAAVIAVFVDLLHYKTIERAIGRGGWWWLAGTFTTSLAFSLQLAFYSDQFTYFWFDAWLFSSIIPFGVALWAIMQGSDGRAVWHQRYEELKQRANERVNELKAELESVVKQHETKMEQLGTNVETLKADLEAEKAKRMAAETELNNLKGLQRAVKKMNPLAQDIVMMIGGNGMTQADIANKHGSSAATVSRIKSSLNGAS